MSLHAIIREQFGLAEKEGRAKLFTLNSGLMLAFRINDGLEIMTLSRPGNPKGPSTTEAHTCAKHAGWGPDYNFRANPTEQTFTIWKKRKTQTQQPAAQGGLL